MPTAAIIQTCVDPRIDHSVLRSQVRQKLERTQTRADAIYVLNNIGGNVGSSFRITVDLLRKNDFAIVLCAVLHHDDCLAARAGLRKPLAISRADMAKALTEVRVQCPVLTGNIRTESLVVVWSD